MPFAGRKQSNVKEVSLLDISLGECTALKRGSIPAGYAEAIINYRLLGTPKRRRADSTVIAVTKPGLSKVNSQVLPNSETPVYVGQSLNYTVIASREALYYLDGSNVPVLIHTIEAATNGVNPILDNAEGMILVCDGGWLKYWDETNFNLCYDVNGYEFDYRSDGDSGSIALDTTGNTAAGQTETSPSWTTGLTLPTGPIVATLSKTGSPTGSAYLKVYDASKVLVATSDALDVSTLTATGVDYTFTFSTPYLRSNSTTYTYALEFTGGSGSDQVNVHYHTVASGGGVETYGGSWSADATKDLLIGVRPSLPPKARWMESWKKRFFVAGDPDYGSDIRYCNLPDRDNPGAAGIFDWGAGELNGANAGVLQVDPGDGAAITGMTRAFGGIVTAKGPKPARWYLLSGTQPADWVLEEKVSGVSTLSGQGIVSAANTVIFFDHRGGQVHDISGVQSYGDVQYKPLSWPIADQLSADEGAFAVAFGEHDQVWFYVPGNEYINVFHTATKGWTRYRFGNGKNMAWSDCRFNWSEMTWAWTEDMWINPAMFCETSEGVYLCADNGYVYLVDSGQTKDDIINPAYILWGRPESLDLEHSTKQAKRLTFQISGLGEVHATGALAFRKDLNGSTFKTLPFLLPLTGQTWAESTMRWFEADWPWDGLTPDIPRRKNLNFNYRYLQAGIEDLGVLSSPLQIDRVVVRSAILGDH